MSWSAPSGLDWASVFRTSTSNFFSGLILLLERL
jgi:hypothetical protein